MNKFNERCCDSVSNLPKINVEKTKEKIIKFIQETVSKANADGIVIGISGGIDSAVSAYLASEAIGSEKVFGVLMPSETTPTEDKIHANELVKILNINYKEIAIDNLLNEFVKITNTEHLNDDVSLGNLKARIRMSILYYYANLKNYIVIGTGNKSEMLIGYFTKFGDGACDMEPIGNLYKCQVKELSQYLKIPNEIINKPPRGGLWNKQTDEEEIGMSYEVLDRLLYMLIDEKKDPEEIVNILKIPISEIKRIEMKVLNNRHKNKVPESSKIEEL